MESVNLTLGPQKPTIPWLQFTYSKPVCPF